MTSTGKPIEKKNLESSLPTWPETTRHSEVIDDATSHLTADDRNAIAEYLLSVPPLASAPAAAE
jgi:hypothetical protein